MLFNRGDYMWFDDECIHSCSNCKYGDKEIEFRKCSNCLLTYSLTGEKYVDWESEERGKIYDLFIQWHSRLGQVVAYCKCGLLVFKKRCSRHC